MEIPSLNNLGPLTSRLGDYARRVGRVAARPALLLYYVMRDPATPRSDKLLILAALSYLVLPIDLIPSRIPLLGWLDEGISIAVVYKKVSKHITPELEAKVDALLNQWFDPQQPQTAPLILPE